jgi:hypothetical protein
MHSRVDGRELALIESYLHSLQTARIIGACGICGVGDAPRAPRGSSDLQHGGEQ